MKKQGRENPMNRAKKKKKKMEDGEEIEMKGRRWSTWWFYCERDEAWVHDNTRNDIPHAMYLSTEVGFLIFSHLIKTRNHMVGFFFFFLLFIFFWGKLGCLDSWIREGAIWFLN